MNYVLIRLYIFLIIGVFLNIFLRKKVHENKKRIIPIVNIVLVVLYGASMFFAPEKYFLKFNSLDNVFNYSHPWIKILDKKEFENYGFVIATFDNDNGIVTSDIEGIQLIPFIKENDSWLFETMLKFYLVLPDVLYNNGYDIYSLSLQRNKNFVYLLSENKKENDDIITDQNGNKFNRMYFEDYCIYYLLLDDDNAEYIFINDRKINVENDNIIGESEKDNIDNNSEFNISTVSDEDLVKILEYIPNVVIDLKYATTDNFTNQVIYENNEAYLRYGTVKKLLSVQNELNEYGYTLIIWDAYRPVSAQFKLWEICPDSTYVSNPNKGYSSHSRGNTIDITIAKLDGSKVEMPTGFDDFTTKADRDYDDVSEESKNNAEFLEKIMKKYGFKGYYNEWWHYTDEVQYSVIE